MKQNKKHAIPAAPAVLQESTRGCASHCWGVSINRMGFIIKTLTIIVSIAIGTSLLTSCGENDPSDDFFEEWIQDENSNGNGGNNSNASSFAPNSMVGKIISWSESNSDGTSGNSDVRIKFTNSTDIQTNFSDWCTYKYTKISSKKAHLNFMAPQRVANVVRTFQYDFDMIFSSDSEFEVDGTLTVNYLSGPNVGKTVYNKFTGKGGYVDSLTGSSPGNSSGDDSQTPGTSENIAKYTGTWTEDVDKSQAGWSLKLTSYTFKADGTYSFSKSLLLDHTGTFKCTSTNIMLYVNSKLETTLSLRNGKLVDSANNKTYSKTN